MGLGARQVRTRFESTHPAPHSSRRLHSPLTERNFSSSVCYALHCLLSSWNSICRFFYLFCKSSLSLSFIYCYSISGFMMAIDLLMEDSNAFALRFFRRFVNSCKPVLVVNNILIRVSMSASSSLLCICL